MDTLPDETFTSLEQLKACTFVKLFNENYNYILFEVDAKLINSETRYLLYCHRNSNIVRVRREKFYHGMITRSNCLMTSDSSLEELFEDSKQELKDWITWNMDLFVEQEDMRKYHMELL